MRQFLVICCGTLICACLSAAAIDTNGTAGEAAAIDAIFKQWNSATVPGCALAVERKGAPLLTRSFGAADLEHEVPITAATVFEAGSVSKQFTAASILLLAAQGKLALGDDVRKYVPELPDYGTPITLNELLGHTSGLRDWGGVEAMAAWPRGSRVYTLTDVLDVAARYSYTNTGFNLLAIIVQRVSKTSLAEFSRQYLFEPLGMIHTQWRDDFRRVVKGRAIAYEAGKDGYRQEMPFEDAYGNGGLLTTVGDLLIWNTALDSGKLGPFVTAEIQRKTKLSSGREIAYARGLFVESYQGVREVSHSGATAGYRAWLGRYPDRNLSIALLCNAADANSTQLAHRVADLFLPKPLPQDSIMLSPDQLTAHGGLFVDARMGLPIRLKMQAGSLELGGRRLVPTSAQEFRMGAATLRFMGVDRFVLLSPEGDELEYRRVQPWAPDKVALAALGGRYTSDEALATYQVDVAKDGGVVLTPRDRQGQAVTLQPVFADTFQGADENDEVVHFTRDSRGGISGLEMSDSRVKSLSFRRIAGEPVPR
jgi:CubicO group peptidase (beta-lactamase class C family)